MVGHVVPWNTWQIPQGTKAHKKTIKVKYSVACDRILKT